MHTYIHSSINDVHFLNTTKLLMEPWEIMGKFKQFLENLHPNFVCGRIFLRSVYL